jgi:hypothetical protein
MTAIRTFILALLFTVNPWTAKTPEQDVAKEIMLQPVGPFGEVLRHCSVQSFLEIDREQRQRRGLFTGLVGRNVPMGTYWVALKCEVPVGVRSMVDGVGSTVSIQSPRQFVVISSHSHVAEYAPGYGPRFWVKIKNAASISGPIWIKAVGLYQNFWTTAKVDETSSQAEVQGPLPGDYLLMVLAPGKFICAKKIRFLNKWDPLLPGEQWITIDLGKGCEVVDAKGITE